jgi:hypothetical protein
VRKTRAASNDFDAIALYEAMDTQRINRGLSWQRVADQIWDQSIVLNRQRRDHPISASTLTVIARRGDCTCQHALFILRWLGRTPESFLSLAANVDGTALPSAGSSRRLRWDLPALYDALDSCRREQRLTWAELAGQLRCSANQLTGIKTVRFAIRMTLAMRIVQWLERPASAFIYVADW